MDIKSRVKQAKREKIYAKIALMAPSGGGKTYSALRLATGMCEEIKRETGKDAKIFFINTEGKRGYYYSDEFTYDIYDINARYDKQTGKFLDYKGSNEPELYVEAIEYGVKEGYDVIIIDSSSHEWEGIGGCLEIHSSMKGNSYTNWKLVTPRHQKFISAIAYSQAHVIATMRGKDEYEVIDNNGKKDIQKLGVGAKQRDGFEYEFTCTFNIDQKTSTAEPQKDNTHIFEHEGAQKLTEEHGAKIIRWANSDNASESKPTVKATESEVQRDESSTNSSTKSLDELKAEVIAKCKELGGTSNKPMMELLAKYASGGNPNNLKDANTAIALLGEMNKLA